MEWDGWESWSGIILGYVSNIDEYECDRIYICYSSNLFVYLITNSII